MSQFFTSGGQSIAVSGDLLHFVCPLWSPLFGTALKVSMRWGVPGVESEHAYSRPGAVTHWLVILGVALSFLICQMGSIGYASDSLQVTLCTSGLSGTALSHRRPSLSALEVRK